MNTNEIEIAFKEYLKESNTNYAIFLNGNWGSGKTYFWNNTLKKIAEKERFKTTTISLYGISSVEMLDKQLRKSLITPTFTALGKTKSKELTAVHAIGKGIKEAFKGITNINIDNIVQEIAIDAYINNETLICFDDLERSNIKKDLVLGYINNLIENRSAKIIILGNQSEILAPQIKKSNSVKNIKNFPKIKEKCIRWTFDLDPEIDKIFDAFYTGLGNPNFKKFLSFQKDYICNLFKTHKIFNFRTMNFYFNVLERVYPEIYEQLDNIKKEVIFYSFICVVETTKGKLNTSTIEEFKNIRNIMNSEQYQKEMEACFGVQNTKTVSTPINDYWRKYFRDNNYPFYEYHSIIEFVLRGNFKREKLQGEIQERQGNCSSEEDIIFEKTTTPYFRSYSDEEFNSIITKFIDYVENGKYELYRYKMIAYWLTFYTKNKFIKLTQKNLINKLKKGMKLAAESNKEPNEKAFKRALREYNDSNIANDIDKELKKLHENLSHKKVTKKLDSLYNILADSKIDKSQIHVIFSENKHNKNFLLQIDSRKISNVLLNSTPPKIESFKFEIWDYLTNGYFLDTYPEILKMVNEIKSYLQNGMKSLHNKPVSKFNLKELIELFDKKIIPSLENKKTIPIE